jgi:oxygen-dependent protoporphyrinogen oxidase
MKEAITHKPTVAVIGGGISGLSAAFWLHRNAMDPIVLEQSDRAGGVIRSESADGYMIDHAANCLLNFLPEVNTLCETVGVRNEKVYRSGAASKRYLLKDGQPVRFPQGPLEFIRTDLWSMTGKARLLAEPFIPRVRSESEETVSQFITRRLGHETLEQVIEPFIGGSYAGDPSQLCARSTFPILYEIERRYGSLTVGALIKRLKGQQSNCPTHLFSFRTGMETLPRAIRHFLGDRFVSGTIVMEIEQRVDKTWDIIAEQEGKSTVYNVDAVVIAIRSMEAGKLLSPIDTLSARMLERVEYSPLVVVYTGFKRDDVGHTMDGIGCMVPSNEGLNILGTLWNTTLFGGRAPDGMVALTNYLGGRRYPDMVNKTDEKLLSITLADLEKILGIRGSPDFVRIIRYSVALPQYAMGHQDILKTVEGLPDRIPGLFLGGSYLRGISVRDCISYGERLARRVTRDYNFTRQNFLATGYNENS